MDEAADVVRLHVTEAKLDRLSDPQPVLREELEELEPVEEEEEVE